MKRIEIYDIEADRIEKLATEHDITDAEVVEAMFALIDNNYDEIEYYI